ncbi:hypothetical protein DFH09DRAFT_1078753 [Mycena vulgaris]|nr:hypothetical protein DFH09DRAFT_1078753 [Mycena vulgaris]
MGKDAYKGPGRHCMQIQAYRGPDKWEEYFMGIQWMQVRTRIGRQASTPVDGYQKNNPGSWINTCLHRLDAGRQTSQEHEINRNSYLHPSGAGTPVDKSQKNSPEILTCIDWMRGSKPLESARSTGICTCIPRMQAWTPVGCVRALYALCMPSRSTISLSKMTEGLGEEETTITRFGLNKKPHANTAVPRTPTENLISGEKNYMHL